MANHNARGRKEWVWAAIRRRGATGCAAGVVISCLFLLGCRQAEPEAATPGPPVRPEAVAVTPSRPSEPAVAPPAASEPAQPAVGPSAPSEAPPPPKPTVPEVVLSQSLRASCVVWVGDTLPGARLWDLGGQPQMVRDHLGARLTVVLLWSAGQSRLARLAAQKLLSDLQEEVLRPFGSDGVKVVAIHVGEAEPTVKQLVEEAGISYPVLVDRNRAYFALLAKEYLPRVYLVDARGKVLWLELNFTELSGKVRDDLIQAIQAALSVAGSG
ncbi:MAG: redoxin domain-containing protein [Thermoguttaceae bacterium]|nr:redoxin domain-containing protein [Thermoguttaceae bacterium]MDW8079631.1 TlpA disulfide reductase family protein [Thermoguttaceae bacterium]